MNKKNEAMLKQGLKYNESARVDIKSQTEKHKDEDEDEESPHESSDFKPKQLNQKLEFRMLNYKKSLSKITMDFNDTIEECK